MTTQRIAAIATLAVGIAIGIALDRSGRRIVPPLVARETPAAVPVQKVSNGSIDPDPNAVTQDEATVIRVARAITPTVVSVTQDEGSGSGIIVDKSGVVLTNAHVVGDSRTVGVGLADGRTLTGQVLGRDPTIDVAVVRVPAQNLPVAPIGAYDKLEVGQSAIAVGNPLGLERTVTAGVVSAINRNPRGISLDGLIQTEPHNPYFYELKGQALLEGGKPNESVAPLRRAAQLSHNAPLIDTLLAQAMVATSNKALATEAVPLLKAVLQRDDDIPDAYNQLAMAYGRSGDLAEADLAAAQAAAGRGDIVTARQLAARAKTRLKVGSPAWVRADDITNLQPPKQTFFRN